MITSKTDAKKIKTQFDKINGRILGLDIGTKRIGIAISTAIMQTASPLFILNRKNMDQDFSALRDLIIQHDIKALIIGIPLHLSGKTSKTAVYIEKFIVFIAENLKKLNISIPIIKWDERFSTKVITKMLSSVFNISQKKQKGKLDDLAACYILQGFLDFLDKEI